MSNADRDGPEFAGMTFYFDKPSELIAQAEALSSVIDSVENCPILYSDTIRSRQVNRDDLWAITTEQLLYLRQLVRLFRAQAEQPAEPVALQAGMNNAELLAAWMKKLPGTEPSKRDLRAFAVGAEVGFDRARALEKADWMRIHYVLKDAGIHPGRTDDHLADVIARALKPAEHGEPVAHLVIIKTADAGETKFFTAPSDPRGFPVYRDSKASLRQVQKLLRGLSFKDAKITQALECIHRALEGDDQDPRIAALEGLLRALDSLTNPDENFDSSINPGPERDELLAAYTACKDVPR